VTEKINYFNLVTISISLLLIFGLYNNATPIYLNLFDYHVNASCAFSLQDKDSVVGNSDNVFIAYVDSLIEIRKFNILNENHSPLVDKYHYEFTLLEDLKGDTSKSNVIIKNIIVEYTGVYVSDLCSEGTKLEQGEMYLLFGRYISDESASRSTDPRSRDGNLYYIFKSIKLNHFDLTKPFQEQEQTIQDVVNEYLLLINNE